MPQLLVGEQLARALSIPYWRLTRIWGHIPELGKVNRYYALDATLLPVVRARLVAEGIISTPAGAPEMARTH